MASARPRRAAAAYNDITASPSSQRPVVLTLRRKELIHEFKDKDKKNVGLPVWVNRLQAYLHKNDSLISPEDVKRWIKNHSWIIEVDDSPVKSSAKTTTKSKATASSSKATKESVAESSKAAPPAKALKSSKKEVEKPAAAATGKAAKTKGVSSKAALPKQPPVKANSKSKKAAAAPPDVNTYWDESNSSDESEEDDDRTESEQSQSESEEEDVRVPAGKSKAVPLKAAKAKVTVKAVSRLANVKSQLKPVEESMDEDQSESEEEEEEEKNTAVKLKAAPSKPTQAKPISKAVSRPANGKCQPKPVEESMDEDQSESEEEEEQVTVVKGKAVPSKPTQVKAMAKAVSRPANKKSPPKPVEESMDEDQSESEEEEEEEENTVVKGKAVPSKPTQVKPISKAVSRPANGKSQPKPVEESMDEDQSGSEDEEEEEENSAVKGKAVPSKPTQVKAISKSASRPANGKSPPKPVEESMDEDQSESEEEEEEEENTVLQGKAAPSKPTQVNAISKVVSHPANGKSPPKPLNESILDSESEEEKIRFVKNKAVPAQAKAVVKTMGPATSTKVTKPAAPAPNLEESTDVNQFEDTYDDDGESEGEMTEDETEEEEEEESIRENLKPTISAKPSGAIAGKSVPSNTTYNKDDVAVKHPADSTYTKDDKKEEENEEDLDLTEEIAEGEETEGETNDEEEEGSSDGGDAEESEEEETADETYDEEASGSSDEMVSALCDSVSDVNI